MGLSVYLEALRPDVVHEDHLGAEAAVIACNCTLDDGLSLYEVLWMPEEVGLHHTWQMVEPLNDLLEVMRVKWDELKQYESGTCAGTRIRLFNFAHAYLHACAKNPDAVMVIKRA